MKKKQILAVLMICSIFVGSKGELVLAESPMDSLQVGETNNVEITSIGSWNASEENLKIEEGKTEYIYIYNNSLELSEEELAECVDTNTDCLNVEICACSIEELLSEENDELEDLINQASNEKNVIWYKITGKSAGTGKIEFIVDEQVITVNITIDQRAVDSSKETEVVSEEIVDQTTENEQNNISEVNHGWSEDGLYYTFEDGTPAKGIVKIEGVSYYFDLETGKLQKQAGWLEIDGKRYFVNDQGKLYVNQFISFGSTRYYMGADGSVQKGIVKANDGKYYHMDETTGKLVRKAGWIEVGDKKYFADDQGKLYVNQFISFGSTRYYMGADGSVQKGIVKANDGKYYHMDETTGKLVRKAGWIEVGDKKYFANDQGKLYSNQFISFGKTYYYCGPDAAIIKGKKYPVNGVLYTFDATGVLQITPGWGEYNGNKYYINPSTGFPYKGWITFGKTAYYANVKGFLVKGWQKIDGYQYYFYPSNYVMARDTTIDGIRIDSSGHAKLRAENYKKGNLCQFLGIDGRKYYNFLKTHISDKTYIGTKYSKNSYKDGANGFSGWVNSAGAGMDCEGFIDNVLKQCGASHPMSVGGGGKGWVAYNNHHGLPYYDYSSKEDMLASGILDYGDIIWMFDTSGPNSISSIHHVGIFVGSNPYEDKLWHSTFAMSNQYGSTVNGNQVSRIVPQASGCKVWRVIKSGAIITP